MGWTPVVNLNKYSAIISDYSDRGSSRYSENSGDSPVGKSEDVSSTDYNDQYNSYEDYEDEYNLADYNLNEQSFSPSNLLTGNNNRSW